MLEWTAAIALLLTPPGIPARGFHWQRIITPPAGAAMQQACVVLDAATFANAAPALRDLRLFQDGTELAYVVEESYDERALNSGVTPVDDRSEYETVASGHMSPISALVAGMLPLIPKGFQTYVSVDARVPVERVLLDPAPQRAAQVSIFAGQDIRDRDPSTTETLHFVLSPEHPSWPVTLGANLQHAITVGVAADEESAPAQRVLLQMRRRSLCYQPRSASALVLYLGGGEGMAAKVYGLANGFSTSLQRPYATLGPLEPNPDLQRGGKRRLSLLALATALLLATLLVTLRTGVRLLRREKGRTRATPSA